MTTQDDWREETEGWRQLVDELELPHEVRTLLPSVSDRFNEARHFLTLACELPRHSSYLQHANWYAGAHMSAVISIRGAVKTDYRKLGLAHDNSALYREFDLRTDTDGGADRDPVAINRAYRELRNLRIHHGAMLVALESRPILLDVASHHEELPARWFFCELQRQAAPLDRWYAQKKSKPLLSSEDRRRFDEWTRTRTLARVATQHLYVLGRAIVNEFSGGPSVRH
jgi:hypothetical protein